MEVPSLRAAWNQPVGRTGLVMAVAELAVRVSLGLDVIRHIVVSRFP